VMRIANITEPSYSQHMQVRFLMCTCLCIACMLLQDANCAWCTRVRMLYCRAINIVAKRK